MSRTPTIGPIHEARGGCVRPPLPTHVDLCGVGTLKWTGRSHPAVVYFCAVMKLDVSAVTLAIADARSIIVQQERGGVSTAIAL